MNVGKLRNLVTIQTRSKSQNEYGELVEVWSDFAKVWAEIKPLKASEFFAAFKEQHEVTHRCVIRYIDGLTPFMRVIHRYRVLEIVAVRNFFERNEYLELICKEVANG